LAWGGSLPSDTNRARVLTCKYNNEYFRVKGVAKLQKSPENQRKALVEAVSFKIKKKEASKKRSLDEKKVVSLGFCGFYEREFGKIFYNYI
jgi:hypothetical protein